ncbi:MAG: hypothetical protein KAH95_08055 [Spirochaetales bacterium]|nr:hypothetical protein [Spirochaetales bacterium]
MFLGPAFPSPERVEYSDDTMSKQRRAAPIVGIYYPFGAERFSSKNVVACFYPEGILGNIVEMPVKININLLTYLK